MLTSWSVFWAAAALLLLGTCATFTQWWSHSASGQAHEDAGLHAAAGIAALGIGLAGAHAMALHGMQFRGLTESGTAIGLDALGLTVAASVGALAVAIAVLSAWFDWRNRAHTRSLATSLSEANIQLRARRSATR